MAKRLNQTGYSLVELLVTLIIISILASVAIRSLKGANEVAKTEKTKQALARIAQAIAGNSSGAIGGSAVSYGYVGDVGALPPNLDALANNPGGYATWKGPYIQDQISAGVGSSLFTLDGWGKTIDYSGGLSLTSTGGSTTISRSLGGSIDALLRNRVQTTIVDAGRTPPGNVFRDSLRCELTYPNGAGAMTTRAKFPNANGEVDFDSIPVGLHDLRVIYLPSGDTVRRRIAVAPGDSPYTEVTLFEELW
ncbi:MAG: type II secretion system GspH family protein [candidate division Zixibacteria bacterium]|nr:type II secretion system GspH family protein [candidate division Zixibacteria bacterium]